MGKLKNTVEIEIKGVIGTGKSYLATVIKTALKSKGINPNNIKISSDAVDLDEEIPNERIRLNAYQKKSLKDLNVNIQIKQLPRVVGKPSTMDIYSKRGTRVYYAFPNNGYPSDQDYARKHLIEGQIYTVQHVKIGSFNSSVRLFEHPTLWFNTSMFAPATQEYEENVRKMGILNARLVEKIKNMSVEERLEHMINAGIYTKDGKLTEQYGGTPTRNKKK